MQLQELKKLVEYDAVGSLMAMRHKGGWYLVALKKGDNSKGEGKDFSLEKARGGIRLFKTLDALAKLVSAELNHHKFTVLGA